MDSQNTKILKYLQTHKRGITSMDAFTKFGITRLSARIFDLRQRGYNISTYLEDGDNRYGEIAKYARYYLEGDS